MSDTTVTRAPAGSAPKNAAAVLGTLILVAAVANLPLAVANVALPSIGDAFDASQTQLNLVAVGYSLGLAASVLWLGAVGDRYGRKMMLLIGVGLSLPACLVAAWAPSIAILIIARIVGGVAAGMAYPTTLSLITALWSGPGRTKSIALWSATGGAISALGPLISGLLLEDFWWGSVFLVTLPLIVIAIPLVMKMVPAHVNEATEPVDNLGGVLSALFVGGIILAINFAAVPNAGTLVLGLVIVGVAALVGFIIRQRRADNPLYDLKIAGRRTFWVAACAGIIVFGSLMGAMFIGQQFLQNVLDYSTIDAGLAILPAAVLMVLCAPRSAKLIESHGSRFTLLIGYSFVLLGFITMLVFWRDGAGYWSIGLGYAFVGAGVGFAGTPSSHSLTSAVPVKRAGMASGTADLQRDFGGAIMQSLLGALLAGGYAAAVNADITGLPTAEQARVTDQVQSELTKSFSSAAETASRYPQYSSQIVKGAQQAFVDGQDWAYAAGIVIVALGGVLIFFMFPKKDAEIAMIASYHTSEAGSAPPAPAPADNSTAAPPDADDG